MDIENSKEMYYWLCVTKETVIKTQGRLHLMVALLYYLSKYGDSTGEPVRKKIASVRLTDAELQRELGISKREVRNYRQELKERKIIDYQYRAAQPTIYWVNLDVLRTEYGYDRFDSNYSDVPSAPKEEVAAVTTENNKSKYSKNGYNKKQTLDNSKNNISYSNSSYIFKKPHKMTDEELEELLKDN